MINKTNVSLKMAPKKGILMNRAKLSFIDFILNARVTLFTFASHICLLFALFRLSLKSLRTNAAGALRGPEPPLGG
jgi:Na+/H+ antiporter NhaD/arsenite permease-like protein